MQHSILVNIAMLSERPTGLEKYALKCAQIVAQKFDAEVLVPKHLSSHFDKVLYAPKYGTLSTGIKGTIFRLIYNAFFFKKFSLIYNPTHHGFFGKNNQIITILDTIPLRYTKQRPLQSILFKLILPRIIKRACAIVAISETAKKELADIFNIENDRLFIVSPGVDNCFIPDKNGTSKGKPFLLVVGATLPHKNVEELLENNNFWKEHYTLIIISPYPKYRTTLIELVQKLGLNEVVEIFDYVSFSQLLSFYQTCFALVYPSLQEGFGLPPLECMACGRPVIASDIPVIKEVCGDAAIYIKSGNKETWERAFIDLNNADLIEQKINLGFKNVQKYSWDNTTRQLESLIKTFLKDSQ